MNLVCPRLNCTTGKSIERLLFDKNRNTKGRLTKQLLCGNLTQLSTTKELRRGVPHAIWECC